MAGRGGIYDDLHGDGRSINEPYKTVRKPNNAYPRVYLRCVDPGTDCECWVVCAKGDPGAVAFLREDGV